MLLEGGVGGGGGGQERRKTRLCSSHELHMARCSSSFPIFFFFLEPSPYTSVSDALCHIMCITQNSNNLPFS